MYGEICTQYSHNTQVIEKVDVYSFAVVLLELMITKRANDPSQSTSKTNLIQMVHNRVVTQEGLSKILDSNCGMSFHKDMLVPLKIVILCTNYMPSSHLSMHEVVKLLKDSASKSRALKA